MAAWTEDFVQANGLRLHYIRTGGADKPALLLLHGLTDNGRYWSPTARALEDRFDVVMLDQRGHGLSDRPTTGYGSDEMAADAAAVIVALGLAPAAVLGHSMGGAVALALAAAHPELVASALLLDPALIKQPADKAAEHRQRMEGWYNLALENQQLSQAELERRIAAEQPSWGAENDRYWAESNLQVYPAAIRLFHVQDSWQELVPRVQCPLLLIYGEQERGSIVASDLAAAFAARAPQARLARIGGAGHSVQREQFDAYIAAVGDFLDH